MSFGFYTYVNGTTFDAINSINFNYVADTFDVTAGSGSRTINIDTSGGLKLRAFPLVQYFPGPAAAFNITVSGNVVSWNVQGAAKIVVIAEY